MQTSEFNKAEALAFVESLRLTLVNRVGFRWMVEKLSALAAYIGSIADENERLNAYVDWADAREDYESYSAKYPDVASRGNTRDDG